VWVRECCESAAISGAISCGNSVGDFAGSHPNDDTGSTPLEVGPPGPRARRAHQRAEC
jgi:hypothetical protein